MKEPQINPISFTRFNALGGYARHPSTLLMLNELAYFEVEGGNVIGIATQDIEDQDFGGIVMARDRKRRFRGVDVTHFLPTPETAQEQLFFYHNPNAAIPMPMEMLPGAAHHFFEKSGTVRSYTPEFHPMSSVTKHFALVNVEEVLAEIGDKTHMVWTPKLGEPTPQNTGE